LIADRLFSTQPTSRTEYSICTGASIVISSR
jgi:hypothetical protein